MSKFSNTMGITQITMQFELKCYCTIGKTLCTYRVQVELEPMGCIPDYLEVQESVNEMNYHWYTMEAACEEVYSRVQKQVANDYKYMKVSIFCSDARHFPVEVVKEVRRP